MIKTRKSKTGEASYYVYVPGHDGKRRYVGAFGNRKEAQRAEQEQTVKHRQIASGELPPEVDHAKTLRVAMGEWIAMLKANEDRKGHRSWEAYQDRADLYIYPYLGDATISRIRDTDVMNWLDDISPKSPPPRRTALSPACPRRSRTSSSAGG